MRIRIRDPESFWPWIRDPGWKKFGSRIRDKHPGSATLKRGPIRMYRLLTCLERQVKTHLCPSLCTCRDKLLCSGLCPTWPSRREYGCPRGQRPPYRGSSSSTSSSTSTSSSSTRASYRAWRQASAAPALLKGNLSSSVSFFLFTGKL